jgi:hypothetical protein
MTVNVRIREKKMRNTLLALLIFGSLLMGATGCAGVHRIAVDRSRVMPVSTIISDPAALEAFGKDIQGGREVVVFIRKGQTVPIKARLTLPMAELEPAKNSMVFTQDTYLLISKSRFMVSPDGERWAQLHDLKTIKELYGFNSKGHLMVGFGITKEDGAQVTLDVAAGAK